ncbi:MAG: DUF1559 domain-containing protein [bacterium]
MFIPKRHSKRAFTLIELLVVIAIIVILAAILFPVFAAAREKARQTACISNLKQLGAAFMGYINDWDRFPYVGNNGEPNRGSQRWGWVCSGNFGECWTNDVQPNPLNPVSPCGFYPNEIANPKAGALWPLIKNMGVYKCPSYGRVTVNVTGGGCGQAVAGSYVYRGYTFNGAKRFDGSKVWSSYGMNDGLMATPPGQPPYMPYKYANITYPADTFVLYDENPETINDAQVMPNLQDEPGTLHSKITVQLMADGHVMNLDYGLVGSQGFNNCGPYFCYWLGNRKYIKARDTRFPCFCQ